MPINTQNRPLCYMLQMLQKLAEEYATLKEKFQGSGLKLSAEMAQYIVRTGQKEQFAEYQRNNARQQGEERS